MNNYAFFVMCTRNYIQYYNALLNSIDKHKLYERKPFDLYFLYIDDGIPNEYINSLTKLSYPIIPIKVNISDKEFNEISIVDLSTRYRYKCLLDYGKKYKVCCLLDADMFITSSTFMNLFDLVNDTNLLISSNEKLKWSIGKQFKLNNQTLFNQENRMMKFQCNVPTLYDVKKWENELLWLFNNIFNIREIIIEENIMTNKDKPINDLIGWNLSLKVHNREKDTFLLPMQQLTQVHSTAYKEQTKLINQPNVGWYSADGDEIFSIHGKLDTENFGVFDNNINEHTKEYINKELRKEWYELNFNHKLNLIPFINSNISEQQINNWNNMKNKISF